LLDRFDIHCPVPPVDMDVIGQPTVAEGSAQVQQRVRAARSAQSQRHQEAFGQPRSNGELTLSELEKLSPLDQESRRLLQAAGRQLGLSARAYVRILRVALTIADLQGTSSIAAEHVAEAIQGRLLDRQPSLKG